LLLLEIEPLSHDHPGRNILPFSQFLNCNKSGRRWGRRVERKRDEFTALERTKLKLKLITVAWVRERIIPTERPPLVGKVSAYFCG
jgi:hypothetical protein